MHTRAALLRQVPGEWEVCDVELDEPRDMHAGRNIRGLVTFDN